MSAAGYASAMLAQLDARMAAVTSENANASGGGFKRSGYRFVPNKEPDSGAEGLYFIDLPRTQRKDAFFGAGTNFWNGTVTVQLAFYRGGGDAGGGDRASVRDAANDDCMKVSDVLENPDFYASATSGISKVIYQEHHRAFDLKAFEVWELSFAVEWRSQVITS